MVSTTTRKRAEENSSDRGEINALTAASAGYVGVWRPLLITAIFSGLRVGELRALEWQHIDFDNEAIMVRRRADKWRSLAAPKSEAGSRDVTMSPLLISVLKEWKLASQGEVVFPNSVGNILDNTLIRLRFWVPLQEAVLGEQCYRWHDLRHFYASYLIDGGIPLKRIQYLLGHASFALTMDTYGHLLSDDGLSDQLAVAERALLATPIKHATRMQQIPETPQKA